jgi:hypothetical protein
LKFNWPTPSKEICTSSVAAFDQNGFSGAAISRPCTIGKVLGMLCIVDEFRRERPAVRITRKLKAGDVIEALCEQFVSRDIRAHIRSAEAPIQANHNQRIGDQPRPSPRQYRASPAWSAHSGSALLQGGFGRRIASRSVRYFLESPKGWRKAR